MGIYGLCYSMPGFLEKDGKLSHRSCTDNLLKDLNLENTFFLLLSMLQVNHYNAYSYITYSHWVYYAFFFFFLGQPGTDLSLSTLSNCYTHNTSTNLILGDRQ